MLKFIFKIIFMSVLLFGVSMYAKYLMTGQAPELNLDNPTLPDIDISQIKDSISDKVGSVKDKITAEEETKETYLYKWRDDKGIIHYTSEKPPTETKNLESIKIDNQTNVVPAVSDNVPDNTANTEPAQQTSSLPSTNMPANVYSPEGIKQLFEQAENVQNLMNEQFEQQEQSINNN